ncbi:MAG: phytoene desaturase [Rubrivivax sp.]|nr:phytoene desaturase [Rubrivivax sp.]
MPEGRRHVVVVGAGVGGLVAAALLARRGLAVTVLESADAPGGKMRPLTVDGVAVDAGPTVLTMRWVFDELFDELGAAPGQRPALTPLDVLARHAWRGQPDTLDLFADRRRSAEAIARFSSPAEGRRFERFCDEAARVYAQLEGPYIRSSRPRFAQMVGDLGVRGLATLAALGPFSTLAQTLGRRFTDPRLQQLFGRYATYCGASPWAAPATLMLVSHVEQTGVWSVAGGMAALARCLAGLAAGAGATLRYGATLEQVVIERGRACGVVLTGGERIAADAVVFNGDASRLGHHLPPELTGAAPVPVAPAARSLSAVTWALHVRTRGFALERHNVFFDADYASEFDDIFRRRRLPERGTVYVCAQDRGAGTLGLPGGTGETGETGHDGRGGHNGRERLLALINAPADGDRRSFDASEIEPCQTRCLGLLSDCGLTLELDSPAQVVSRTPADFQRLFPGSGGALYGAATHGWMSLFRRSGAATRLPGLYLAGGSVHPGPGVPMAAMSGRLAAATLLAHLDSTRRSSRVRISGGMSMPSATTAATP